MMTQEERLDYLVEAFKAESDRYKDIETPRDTDGKRRLLRSLMNVRMPGALAPEVERVQDEYLQERTRERGIVTLDDIAPVSAAYKTGRPADDRLSLWQGDITRLKLDAIVNAANSQMLGCFVPMHNCIDNCIQTYAGVQMRAECYLQMQTLRAAYGADYEQPTAVPMLTDAYSLPAKKVIHVVGPIVEHELTPELEQDLADCYSRVLDMCLEKELESVAFCCISTGVFLFPNQRAAEIAVQTVRNWLQAHPGSMERVVFNVFGDKDREIYEQLLMR